MFNRSWFQRKISRCPSPKQLPSVTIESQIRKLEELVLFFSLLTTKSWYLAEYVNFCNRNVCNFVISKISIIFIKWKSFGVILIFLSTVTNYMIWQGYIIWSTMWRYSYYSNVGVGRFELELRLLYLQWISVNWNITVNYLAGECRRGGPKGFYYVYRSSAFDPILAKM